MTERHVRRSLPAMDYPYEGIVQFLEIVAREQPTIGNLQSKLSQRRQSGKPTPFFREGKDDILHFVWKLLNLVYFDGACLHLTEEGRRLHTHLYSDHFGIELFRYLLLQSRQRFSYFYQVIDELRNQVQLHGRRLPTLTYRSILHRTNRRSSKEIDSLLRACGIVRDANGEIEVDALILDEDADTLDLQRLLQLTRSLVSHYGTVVYSDLIAELGKDFPIGRLSELEPMLRSHLRINATRTTEYVDGVLR